MTVEQVRELRDASSKLADVLQSYAAIYQRTADKCRKHLVERKRKGGAL